MEINCTMYMSSTQVFQRLLSMAYASGPPSPSVFTFELATVSPALFNDDGSMRKTQKSKLAEYILKLNSDITHCVNQPGIGVIDGCAVLHHVAWPKVGTLHDVCTAYVTSVKRYSTERNPVFVVFDSYGTQSTKEPEQKRRKMKKISCADALIERNTPVPS